MLWMELRWIEGTIYSEDLANIYWLSYYSKLFDFVEIDSTFYKTPSKFMVKNWNKRVQENFRFAIVPKVITHDNIKRYRKGNRTFWDDGTTI